MKVVRIGIHGSKQACGEALSCSSVARSQTSLRTELRATTAPTMPNVVESMLDYAFRCFPHASPALTSGAGKRQTAPKDRSRSLIFLGKFGAGEGIRTLDPNLGKVPNRLANHLRRIAQAHRVKTLGFQVGVPPQHFPILVAGDESDVFD